MWEEDGLNGLEGLRGFSRRGNGNSGSLFFPLLCGKILSVIQSWYGYFIFLSSKTSTSETAMVIGLGGLNLFGIIVLGAMLKYGSLVINCYSAFSYMLLQCSDFFFFFFFVFIWREITVKPSGLIKFVSDMFPLLQVWFDL